jgi:hypothetical protein
MAEIILTFNEDGTCTSETKGVKGQSCKDVSGFIEKALGNKTSDKTTREFYEKEDNKNILRR